MHLLEHKGSYPVKVFKEGLAQCFLNHDSLVFALACHEADDAEEALGLRNRRVESLAQFFNHVGPHGMRVHHNVAQAKTQVVQDDLSLVVQSQLLDHPHQVVFHGHHHVRGLAGGPGGQLLCLQSHKVNLNLVLEDVGGLEVLTPREVGRLKHLEHSLPGLRGFRELCEYLVS